MNIKGKLLFAFCIYVFLALVLGLFAYRELKTITKRLAFVELADDMANAILEVRRHEKNYLLFKEKESLDLLNGYLEKLDADISNRKEEIGRQIGRQSYDSLSLGLGSYRKLIEQAVENFDSQGSLIERIREKGRKIESALGGEDLRKFLVVRSFEKNLMLYKDRESYEALTGAFGALKAGDDPVIMEYGDLLEEVYGRYRAEEDLVQNIRLEGREIQSLTKELSRNERARIAAILDRSMTLLAIAFALVIITGVVVNIKFSRNIAKPIATLEAITRKMAMGEFSERADITGKDEIASLGASFNKMSERLRDTMASLEQTIKVLEEKQAKLVEAEKLAAVGLLAAGVAHEINNPLTSVLTFSNLMLEKLPPGDPNRERLMMMARETARARVIIRNLQSFGRETALRPSVIDINCPLREIIDTLVAQGAFNGIELDVDLREGLPEVNADSSQLGQVMMNILLNAIHSITPPGRIGVSTREADGYLEVIVSDTGCGIPEEHLGKVFDPFFTTKDTGKGTGLGLAVSYGIIKKHGGDIEVRSRVGKGSVFTVRLPAHGEIQGHSC
jgi:signal transduction histidine kinase